MNKTVKKVVRIVSEAKMREMLVDDDYKTQKRIQLRDHIEWCSRTEYNDLQYAIYKDRTTGIYYACNEAKGVGMGFNSNEPGREEKFIEIMNKEGRCEASWGCTGRTLHQMLARQLAEKYPQYRWEIGYNYQCTAYDDKLLEMKAANESEHDVEMEFTIFD